MVGRLLWKESREGWLIVAAAFAAPAVLVAVREAIRLPMISDMHDVFGYAAVMLSTAVMMLWAIGKGNQRRKDGGSPLGHIPGNPWLDQLVSVLIPLGISLLVGLWVGRFVPDHPRNSQTVVDVLTSLAAMYVTAGFAGCYLLSAALSTWAALLTGFVWVIVGLIWMVDAGSSWDANAARHTWAFFLNHAAIAAVISLLVFLLTRRKWSRVSSIVSLSLLVMLVLQPIVYMNLIAPHKLPAPESLIYSSDRSLLVQSTDPGVLQWQDRRTGWTAKRSFHGDAKPIAFDIGRRLYIALQKPGEQKIAVLRWDGHHVAHVGTVIGRRYGVREWFGDGEGSVSPDCRYLTFPLKCPISDGEDQWVVDTRKGESWIAVASSYLDRTVSWRDREVIFSGYEDLITVDLVTRQQYPFIMTPQEGDHR